MTTTRKLALALCCVAILLPAVVWAQAAALLNYGQPTEGTLNAGEYAEYTFEGREGEKPVIVMNAHGGSMQPAVELYDPQGRKIGEDNGSGPKGNALLKGLVLPETGTYTVRAINRAADGSGEYGLLIDEESNREFFDGVDPTEHTELQAYSLSQPWNHTNITYSVLNTLQGFSEQDVQYVIATAFQAWASVAPVSFMQVQAGQGDINIEFAPIDGPSNILGKACPPYNACGSGSVTFDSQETWTLGNPNGYGDISFLGVATHEFGHAIGLLHTDDPNALMYPQYSPYNLAPAQDDAAGVQRLYGQGTGTVSNPGGGAVSPNNPNQMQVTGEINDQTYTYFWDFDVVAGDTVTITMDATSGDLDSFMVLLDGNNNILAFDDDSGGNRNARIANLRFPQAGTFTVAATRYAQAQGYTDGEYVLSIEYDVGTTVTPAPNATRIAPPPTGTGTVTVNRGNPSQVSGLPALDTVLSSPFSESAMPTTQQRSGQVFGEQTYVWSMAWCATSAQSLRDNLANMTFSFAVNGQAVDPSLVARNESTANGLSCMEYFVTLSGWTMGNVSLTATMHMNQPVFDGQTIYAAGDYVYQYNIAVT